MQESRNYVFMKITQNWKNKGFNILFNEKKSSIIDH